MSKTIWIINQYASTPETAMGGRHYYLADELGKLGYKVYLIGAGYTHILRHPPDMEGKFLIDHQENFTFIWVKTLKYQEAHSKKRIINWLIFPWRIQKLMNLIPDKPDAIICSSPSLISFLGAERLAKKTKSILAFEVRDIWPLTLVKLGGYSPKHPFIRLMQWIEKHAYKQADIVISNLENSIEHMVSQGMNPKKFHWIPNGVSLPEISKRIPLNFETESLLPKDKFIIGYTGTLGVANALSVFINAAAKLNKYQDKIAFVLVGSGKEKNALQQQALSLGLNNIYFINSIPKNEIQAMLSKFDICYIGWRNESLYKFGIGANKLPEYLYSGKPIIHSYSGNCDPVQENNAGITIPSEDYERLAKAILELYNAPQSTRDILGKNGHKAAIEHYEYANLAKKLEKCLFPSE